MTSSRDRVQGMALAPLAQSPPFHPRLGGCRRFPTGGDCPFLAVHPLMRTAYTANVAR